MTLAIVDYRVKPEEAQAALLTEENLEEAARWCGGVVDPNFKHDWDSAAESVLKIPTLEGIKYARPGQYLLRDEKSGRFSLWDAEDLFAKYESFNKPQKINLHPPGVRGGSISKDPGPQLFNNSGEAYGPYADQRYWQGHDALDMS